MQNVQPLFARDDVWSTLFWISFGSWYFTEAWIRFRDRRRAAGRDADGGSGYVIMLLFPLGVGAAVAAVYFLPWAQIVGPQTLLLTAALLLIWGGMIFRLWAVLTLGRFFRTIVRVHDDHQLITSGPYRLLRHPSYTGAMMTLMGFGLAMGNWLSLLLATVVPLIAFLRRIQVEERALAGRFGDAFAEQKRRSWALVPFLW